jgi:hypothetical protein
MNALNRRQMIRMGMGIIPLGWGSQAIASAGDSSATIVDTHLHCFGGNDPRFPYHARAPYRPDVAATPEHLLKCMDDAGVDFAVVVHPEPYQDDHRYLEHCLRVVGSRVKGTCLFFADRPGSVDSMARLVKRNPGQIVAARVHAYAPGGSFDFVDVGVYDGCALDGNGTARCWSPPTWNTVLGVSANVPRATFVDVAAGYHHACGLTVDDKVLCWGRNAWGEGSPPTFPCNPDAPEADWELGTTLD